MNHPNTRRADLPETPWAFAALCRMPSEIFDVATGRLQTAKAACAHCTVAHQCLRWAITTRSRTKSGVVVRLQSDVASVSPSCSTYRSPRP